MGMCWGDLLSGKELLYLEPIGDTGGHVNTSPKAVCKPLCVSECVCLSGKGSTAFITSPRGALILSI